MSEVLNLDIKLHIKLNKRLWQQIVAPILVLAEIEFTTDDAMAEFQPPDFCAVEVTDDPFFRGGHLATIQADALRQVLHVQFQCDRLYHLFLLNSGL